MSATSYADLRKDIKRRMDSAVDVVKKEFAGLRTGRASTALIEPITVDAYGSQMPLNQVGNIGVAGTAHDHRPSLGQSAGQGRGKGDSRTPAGSQPGVRWPTGPHSRAAAQRGAPQGTAEDRRQIRRTGPHLGAQCAPRRDGGAERSSRRTASSPRTNIAITTRKSKLSRTKRSSTSMTRWQPKTRKSCRFEHGGRKNQIGRAAADPCSDHHGRQRALGQGARICRASPAQARRRGGARDGAGGGRFGYRLFDSVRVFIGKLETAPRRSAGSDGPAAHLSARRSRRTASQRRAFQSGR